MSQPKYQAATIAVAAMRAGLEERPLPDFGVLPKEMLAVVNQLYEEARNWASCMKVGLK